jgi:hypothetical protein
MVICLLPALLLAFPLVAVAAPGDEDEPPTASITMEYRYAEGETPNIPDTVTQFGATYHLVSQTDPVLESTLPITRTYSFRIDGAVSADDLAKYQNLPNLVLTPVEIPFEREVDKTEVLEVPNNDVDELPLSKKFDVTSATAAGGTAKVTLERAGVKYKVLKYNALERPILFEATVVYRGIETYNAVGYYTAETTYTSDSVVGSTDQYIIVATYEPDEPPADITPAPPAEQPAVEESPTPTPEESPVPTQEEVQFGNQTGNPLTDIIGGNVPMGSFTTAGAWSVLSMLLSVIAAAITVVSILTTILRRKGIAVSDKTKVYDDASIDRNAKLSSTLLQVASWLFGILTIVTWFVLDNLNQPMVWINKYTIVVLIVFVIHLVLKIVHSAKVGKGDEKLAKAGVTN